MTEMNNRISAKEYRQGLAKPKQSKFRNRKVVVDGHRFDSKRESEYYGQLKQREKAGEVYEVEMQRPFAIVINGQLVCTYKADFHFWDAVAKRRRVVDVKGFATPEFKLKAKLMKAVLGLEVEVVK
jgi:hypothetical protein